MLCQGVKSQNIFSIHTISKPDLTYFLDLFRILYLLSIIYKIRLCLIQFFLYLFLIEGELLYTVVLVSAIHRHASAMGIHMSCLLTFPLTSHPFPPNIYNLFYFKTLCLHQFTLVFEGCEIGIHVKK